MPNVRIVRLASIGSGMLIGGSLVAGCGAAGGLGAVPDDCVLFLTRGEAVALFNIAVDEREDGSSEAAAFAKVTAECVDENCEGDDPIGVCAVSCASCADALTEIAYADDE